MTIESYSDGSGQNASGHGCSSFIIVKDQSIFHQGTLPHTGLTNNEAEYEALIMAVQWLVEHTKEDLTCYVDSELIQRQVKGLYQVNQPNLIIAKARLLTILGTRTLTVKWVPRTNKFIKVADQMNRTNVRKAMAGD